jgi:hypothetical protein
MSDAKLFESICDVVMKVAQHTDKADHTLLEAIKVLSEGTMNNDNLLLDLINALIDRVNKLENTEQARFELLVTLTDGLMQERQQIAILQARCEKLELKVFALNLKGTVN